MSYLPLAALLSVTAGTACCFGQVVLPELVRWSMPDFDQRREGLAGNGGMHCVPTSHANMLAYIANHGFPNVFPGVTEPTLASEYDEITNHIFTLGIMMGTTAADGTNGNGLRTGFNAWLSTYSFLFNVQYVSGPDVRPLSLYNGLKGNSMAAFCYGRYEYSPSEGMFVRDGGHCVTLRGMSGVRFPYQSGGWPTVKYRDPATDEGNVSGRLTGQSPFKTSVLEIRRFSNEFEYWGEAAFWELQTNQNDDKRRLIDGLTVVNPIFVLQPDPSTNLIKIKPILTLPDAPEEESFPLTAVSDAALGQLPSQIFACGQFNGDNTLLVVANPYNPGYTNATFIPGGSGRIAVSPKNECFYVSGNLLRRYRPSDEDSTMPQIGSTVTLPTTVSNLAFDDARNMLCMLMGDGSVREHGTDLAIIAVKTLATPPGWPATGGPSHRRIVPAQTPGEYWFGPLTGGQLKRYAPDTTLPTRLVLAETVTPPAGATMTDFTITDRGTLLLKRGNNLQELHRVVGSGWAPDTSSPFNGMSFPGGGTLKVSRSRISTNPAAEASPGWRTNLLNPPVLGVEVPDCLADLGRAGGVPVPDGLLNNNDFIVFIDLFFALNPKADIGVTGGLPGADGIYNNNDFIVFIDRFFTPCQ